MIFIHDGSTSGVSNHFSVYTVRMFYKENDYRYDTLVKWDLRKKKTPNCRNGDNLHKYSVDVSAVLLSGTEVLVFHFIKLNV